ncbi:MAG: nuclear transport factor 2 family protein [Actinobacteria bacterium]|nr:nuclear transport factor 2 family protein [Actinomycetota bacterium]
MNVQPRLEREPSAVIDRLVQATNNRDLEALIACFSDSYVNDTPAHPHRGFRGSEQVRRNWTQILAAVPDIRVQVVRTAVDGHTVWTEWEMSGSQSDGAAFLMRGVIIFEVADGSVTSARFYVEPVEETSGDVNAAVSQITSGRVAT